MEQIYKTKELLDYWLDFVKQNLTRLTFNEYRSISNRFVSFLPEEIEKVSISHIEGFLMSLEVKKSSLNTYLTALKSFFNFCAKRYDVINVTLKIPYFKTLPSQPRVIEEKEYQKLLSVSAGIDKDIIIFLANTGLRISEFWSLNWSNISSDYKFITLNGKGNKQRVVPLNSTCQEVLRKYKRNHKLPLSSRYKIAGNYKVLCDRLAKRARVKHFSPHAFRHFFCTRLLQQGINIYKVSKILGHSSVLTTEKIYAHLVPQDLLGLTEVLKN